MRAERRGQGDEGEGVRDKSYTSSAIQIIKRVKNYKWLFVVPQSTSTRDRFLDAVSEIKANPQLSAQNNTVNKSPDACQ